MKYLQHSFTLPACNPGVTQEEWDRIFGSRVVLSDKAHRGITVNTPCIHDPAAMTDFCSLCASKKPEQRASVEEGGNTTAQCSDECCEDHPCSVDSLPLSCF